MRAEVLTALSKGRHFYVIGLGSVAQATLPLMFKEFQLSPAQVTLIAPEPVIGFIEGQFGHYEAIALHEGNLQTHIGSRLQSGDFVLNVANEVSSFDLAELCQAKGALYLDTVIEPWGNWYDNPSLPVGARSNYALRETALKLRGAGKPTAVLTHGANPGLVSHFVKRAIMAVANHLGEGGLAQNQPDFWSKQARAIDLRVIHIAEYDSQQTSKPRPPSGFFNTWSVAGFIAEAGQPAELGWGTHEKQLPPDAGVHSTGSEAAIYLNSPGSSVRVQSWIPHIGSFHGFLVTHGESISLADWLTVRDAQNQAIYRPTVHYAYHPCDAAIASLHDLSGRQWRHAEIEPFLLVQDVSGGDDTLGVLLGYGQAGCYWYGSHLSATEARRLCPTANATSLQVAAGVLGGMVWAMENPMRGIVEPEEMDSERVLEIAQPYLGKLFGEFSDWTPTHTTHSLFPVPMDREDPWQFFNVRVA